MEIEKNEFDLNHRYPGLSCAIDIVTFIPNTQELSICKNRPDIIYPQKQALWRRAWGWEPPRIKPTKKLFCSDPAGYSSIPQHGKIQSQFEILEDRILFRNYSNYVFLGGLKKEGKDIRGFWNRMVPISRSNKYELHIKRSQLLAGEVFPDVSNETDDIIKVSAVGMGIYPFSAPEITPSIKFDLHIELSPKKDFLEIVIKGTCTKFPALQIFFEFDGIFQTVYTNYVLQNSWPGFMNLNHMFRDNSEDIFITMKTNYQWLNQQKLLMQKSTI